MWLRWWLAMAKIQTKLANRANYGSKRTAKILFLVIHFTSNKGDTAKNNADYFAREIVKASAHYFVDENEIWQSVPDDCVAWHCGGKAYYHSLCRNANSIGIEICMNDKQGKIRQKSIDHAAELIRELMDRYDIPVENVVRHYDVTHKYCPGPMVDNPALWAEFKKKLEAKPMAKNNEPSAWAKDAWEKATKAGVVDGTRPTEPITRQEIVVILDRLKLIK